jgi:hypothetical protein
MILCQVRRILKEVCFGMRLSPGLKLFAGKRTRPETEPKQFGTCPILGV